MPMLTNCNAPVKMPDVTLLLYLVTCLFTVDGHRAIRDDSLKKFPTTALKTKEFMRLTALSGTIFTG